MIGITNLIIQVALLHSIGPSHIPWMHSILTMYLWNGDANKSGQSMQGQPFNFHAPRAGMTDDTAAPLGCDSIMVLVPCHTLERERDWADLSRDDVNCCSK